MAKDKASKEGNDIGVDLASNIAKAITRVLSTYDFSPLNKSLTKGMGTIDVSSLIKSSDAKIKQLAVDIKSSLEKSVGNVSITPTLDTTPLEKAGDLVRTLVNLTEEANKKTAITADLYEKITATANELVASKRMEKEAAESLAKAYEAKLPPTPDVNPFQDIADVQQQIVESTAKQGVNYSRVSAEQVKQIPQGVEILKLLRQANLQHKEINVLIGAITGGEYKLVEAHKSAEAVLAEVTEQSKTQEILNDTLLQQGIARLSAMKQQGASAEELTAADREQYQLLQNTLTARELLVDAAQQAVDAEGNQLASANVIANLLEDELDLTNSLITSYGLTGKAAQYVAEKIKERVDPAEILNSTELEAIKTMQKSVEIREKMLEAQGKGISLNRELESSYKNSDKLLEQTLQHSNLIFFKQVDVAKALEDQKQLRTDLIDLAQQEGAAGEGARSLMQADVGLFKEQVDLLGYKGESAAYVVEQLKKERDIASILKDRQLEILETQQKSIDFRKKDLELQSLTKKRIEEIKKSHDGIKDRIKQTLDFSKELAKDPKALGMFAAAQVGIGLHKATHAMHELVEQGMQAGEAVHVMADGISVMSVLGLSKVSGINKELINQFGTMNVLTKDQRHTIGEMATKFGLAEQEAVNLTMAISRMPGESADTAANFANTAKHVGKMSGVMPSQIMKEMAKNSGLMATYSKGGAEGFAKAAAQAKKMGVELSSVLNAAEKTLDFENSINAQMEASLLIGKSMNFDRMRAAALSGDANAIMEEQAAIMQQVGSLDNMNVLQKKKLAEAMGLTVDELTKMNEAQQFQNKYFGENASALDNVVGGVLKYGGAIGGFIAQNGMMILGIVQTVAQLATLQAMKAANTASTITDTSVTAANTAGTKLNTAQKQLAKSLEASGIPIRQAIIAARQQDTLATTSNTGAVTGNTFATKISTMANGAWNLVKNIGLGILRMSGVLWLAEKIGTLASAAATGIATGAQFVWNAAKGLAITLWNSETAVTLRNAIAKRGAAAAEGAWNIAAGIGNMLKKTAIGMWIVEKANMIASTVAKWANVGATTAQATANGVLAGTQAAVGTTGAAASGGLASFGAGLASLSAAAGAVPVILALGAAILMIGGGIAVAAVGLAQLVASFKELSGGQIAGALGAVVAVMAGFVGIVYAMVPAIGALAGVTAGAALPMLAFGGAILMVGAGVAIAALGMSKLVESFKGLSPEQAFAAAASIGAMAAAFYFLTPALVAVASSATVSAGPLLALGAAVLLMGAGIAVASLGISTIAQSLTGLGATSQGLDLVGTSLLKISAGLGGMAIAGLAAMPIIGALAGLAAVAPMLAGLGNLFGGGEKQESNTQTATQTVTQTNTGGGDKEDKMSILIEEIRGLRSEMSKGGTINMDGKKVGDVLRLAMNTSGVR